MAWQDVEPMEERIRFVKDGRMGLYTMTELCERYGISRKTGYKWLARFEAEGAAGLVDRSRAPHRCEHRMSEAVREALLEVRRKHPSWGPRKLLARLEGRHPRTAWPAASSVGELLRREGLVDERRRPARREPHPGPPLPRAILNADNGSPSSPRAMLRGLLDSASGGSSSGSTAPDRTGEPRAERRTRALPPHAEGRDGQATGGQSKCAATPLQPLPQGLQRRASARGIQATPARATDPQNVATRVFPGPVPQAFPRQPPGPSTSMANSST
jgi:transposase